MAANRAADRAANPTRRSLIVLALMAALGSGAPAVARATCTAPANAASLAAEALNLINAERRAKGLTALAGHRLLTEAAEDHACFMAASDQMTHTGRNGQGVGQRLRRAGYSFKAAAENVAAGHRGAAAVVAGWMASPPHRKAMLRRDLRDAGLGLRISGDGLPYWALILAHPR